MVVDLTELAKTKAYSPCAGCGVGWSSISQWTDPETGHLMQETQSCFDDCKWLRGSARQEALRAIGRLSLSLHYKEPTNPDFYSDQGAMLLYD